MGMDKSGPVSKPGHFVLRSKNAVNFDDIFADKKTPQEILNSIECSEMVPNDNLLDPKIRYFHMFGATGKS